MDKYVSESEESLSDKLEKFEVIAADESAKLYIDKKIKYEFDHYSGEVRLVFVKQTGFEGGKLSHALLAPLKKRIREIDKKWYVGIMVYGRNRQNVKNEKQVS